jgi:hypothetical protein
MTRPDYSTPGPTTASAPSRIRTCGLPLPLSLKLRSRFSACRPRHLQGVDICLPRTSFGGEFPRFENSVRGTVFVIVKGGSEIRFAGLAAVRITWITAIVVCVLAILTGLLSGTDSRNSSGQLPGFAFSDGGDPLQQSPESAPLDPAAALASVVDGKAQRTMAAAPQGDRSQRASERAPGHTHSGARVPKGTGSQPGNEGGRGPSPTLGPKPPQPPSSTPSKPTPAPPVSPPKPAPLPSVSVSASPPSVSVKVPAPVQTPILKVPDVSVQLP